MKKKQKYLTIEFQPGSDIVIKGTDLGLQIDNIILIPGTNAVMKIEDKKLLMTIGKD